MNDAVAADMAVGLSFVCATCDKFRFRQRGYDGCRPERPCGGPGEGRAFPEYSGPFAGQLAKRCFVCGVDAENVLDGNGGKLGVCDRHVPLAQKLCRLKEEQG